MTSIELDRALGGAAPIIDRLARFGFAMKGIVTILIGALALRYALGWGGNVTGSQGALEALLAEPFGELLLAILVVGLAAYALWMFVEAFADPERKGTNLPGLAERAAFFVTGVGYVLLARATMSLVVLRDVKGGMGLDDLARVILTPVTGRFAIGIAGATVMVAGLLQLRLGITAGFRHILCKNVSRAVRIVIVTAGVLGYITLAILSLIVGYSLIQVAIRYNPAEAGGWAEALWLMVGLVEGRWLLGLASIGLICYGFYFVFQMRYRTL